MSNAKPAYIKHGDTITVRSQRSGKRLQDDGTGKFSNTNQGSYEKFHIEKCGGGTPIGSVGTKC